MEPGAERVSRARGPSARTAGGLALAGGLLMILGAVLEFASFEGFGLSESVGGLETDDGKLFLGVGVAILVFGAVIWGVQSVLARRVLGIVGVLVSAFMVFAAIVDITGLGDEIPDEFVDQITVSAGIGLYVVLIGSVLALIGSGLAIFVPREPQTVSHQAESLAGSGDVSPPP